MSWLWPVKPSPCRPWLINDPPDNNSRPSLPLFPQAGADGKLHWAPNDGVSLNMLQKRIRAQSFDECMSSTNSEGDTVGDSSSDSSDRSPLLRHCRADQCLISAGSGSKEGGPDGVTTRRYEKIVKKDIAC